MDSCFRGLKRYGGFWYLDDIVQASGDPTDSEEEALTKHAQDLDRLFGRALSRNFRFSIEKSDIAKSCVTYLGLIIGNNKVFASDKTKKSIDKVIETAKIDNSVKQFQRLFGFFNYSSKFIPWFTKQRAEINKMRLEIESFDSKNETFIETKLKYQGRLMEILHDWKEHITKNCLMVPKANTELHLFSDSSGFQIGIALFDQNRQPILFHGRVCSDTEKRYGILDLELLAAAQACESVKHFIYRASVTHLYIDNSNARTLINNYTQASSRNLRFINRIKEFPNIKIKAVPSEKNPSDIWSRDVKVGETIAESHLKAAFTDGKISNVGKVILAKLPIEQKQASSETFKKENLEISSLLNLAKKIDAEIWESEKRKNVFVCMKIVELWQTSFEDENPLAKMTLDLALAAIEKVNELELDKNKTPQTSTIKIVLKIMHIFCHHQIGRDRMHKMIKLLFPEWSVPIKLVQEVLDECETCVRVKTLGNVSANTKRHTLSRPGQIVAADHLTLKRAPEKHGFVTIITLVDEFSKFVTAIPCESYSHTVALEKIRLWFSFLGKPEKLLFDNYFRDSEEIDEFGKDNQVEIIYSDVYRPQTNAQCGEKVTVFQNPSREISARKISKF